MKNRAIALTAALILSAGIAAAEEAPPAYSIEEMHAMASAYLKLTGREKRTEAVTFDDALKAGAFRGYVAALLDHDEKLASCRKAKPLDDTTNAAAKTVADSPASGPGDAGKRLHFALLLACK